MRNPENIRGVCNSAPDFLGFIFYPQSKRYVGHEPDPGIFVRVPSSIQKVGVFVDEEIDQLMLLCKKYGLKVAQLHGKEPPEYCQQIKDAGLNVFKAFSLDDRFDFSILEKYVSSIDYFLFDTKGKLPGGTGKKFNWEILDQYQLDVPFLLSGGIGPDDVEEINKLNHPQLAALDINSGFELEPALKDVSAVRKFIQKIKN